ncbi:MAG: hypothetical protein ACFE0O_04380 [Opitutales bacterium]
MDPAEDAFVRMKTLPADAIVRIFPVGDGVSLRLRKTGHLITPGTYMCWIESPGYERKKIQRTFTPGSVSNLTVRLNRLE